MLWPLGAYYFGMPAVAARLVGCALGFGARQERAYALQIVGAPLQGVYRGLRQCSRNAEEEDAQADAEGSSSESLGPMPEACPVALPFQFAQACQTRLVRVEDLVAAISQGDSRACALPAIDATFTMRP
jgi:hypothetical protein